MARLLFAVILVVIGIGTRTIWHSGDNVEFVTTSAFLSASYLGFWWAQVVPITIMMVTDMMIGNTNIFIFTWSAYAIIGLFGYWGLKSQKPIHSTSSGQEVKSQKYNKIIRAAGLGIFASLWFYLWTNFGVWLLDSWGMYPKTLTGLMDSYFYGLPFLKANLLGNLIFIPLSFFVVETLKKDIKALRYWDIKKIIRIKDIHNS